MDLVIDWEGPYRLQAFLTEPDLRTRFDHPGVYLWTALLPDGTSRLSYVGRALGRPTLWRRQVHHYACMIGGLYTIPAEFRTAGTRWTPGGTDPAGASVMVDRARFAEVVDDGFRYASACHVYLRIITSGPSADVVERNLLYDLRPTGTDRGTGTVPGTRLKIGHQSPRWLTPEIRRQLRDDSIIV